MNFQAQPPVPPCRIDVVAVVSILFVGISPWFSTDGQNNEFGLDRLECVEVETRVAAVMARFENF